MTPTCDAKGNLTADGTNSFSYDAENWLVSASGAHNASLAYDPLGRLWQVTSGSSTTRFLWDGDALVVEYDGSGNLLRRHVYSPEAAAPVISYEGSGLSSPRFPFTDERGSVVALADGSGAALAINSYDEYGIPASTNTGRFQYAGQVWLAELGMSYNRNRIYSPTLGRFLQTDPIGFAGGMNIYGYTGNDPVNFVDPMGFGAVCIAMRGDDCIEILVVGHRPDTSGGVGGVDGGHERCGVPRPTARLQTNACGSGLTSARTMSGRGAVSYPCTPSRRDLEHSGPVTFAYLEGGATALLSSGDAIGHFTTTHGYSGWFHTYFDGGVIGVRGISLAGGIGHSENLATFYGENYNLVTALGYLATSDSYDPQSNRHVGETDSWSTPGLGIGATRSYTTFFSVRCPAAR